MEIDITITDISNLTTAVSSVGLLGIALYGLHRYKVEQKSNLRLSKKFELVREFVDYFNKFLAFQFSIKKSGSTIIERQKNPLQVSEEEAKKALQNFVSDVENLKTYDYAHMADHMFWMTILPQIRDEYIKFRKNTLNFFDFYDEFKEIIRSKTKRDDGEVVNPITEMQKIDQEMTVSVGEILKILSKELKELVGES